MHRAPEEEIRSNIIITVGDLFFRYPNLIEPWTSHIYGVLRDSVFNHMVMITLLVRAGSEGCPNGPHSFDFEWYDQDQGPDLRDCTLSCESWHSHSTECRIILFRTFEKEYRFPSFFIFIGNSPIYNIFPDCISLLINNEDLSYENYSYIIQYLAKFIDKVCESSISSLNRRNRPQHWWISSASASPWRRVWSSWLVIFIDPRQWKCIIFAIYCLPLSSVCAQHLLLYKKPLKDLLPYEDIHSILLQMLTKVFLFPAFSKHKDQTRYKTRSSTSSGWIDVFRIFYCLHSIFNSSMTPLTPIMSLPMKRMTNHSIDLRFTSLLLL